MQATGSRALKALASRIHNHAVPLSKKESQQLLSLLSQSFDRHLDRYHPVHGKQAEREATAGVKAARHRSIDPNHAYSSHDTKSSSALSSAEHILKILDHPLLSRRANHKATSNESTITREEALPWLENKFADASASLNDIFLCLRALCGSPASKLHEADILFLRDQQASRKIEAWLFPEDVATVETLYATSHISPIWVKLLVLEGRQDTVRAKLLSNVTSAENKAVSIGLLVSFFRIVLENGAGIEEAVREVLLLKTHPHISRAINQILFHIPKMGQAIPIPTYDQLLSLTRGSRSETLASAVLTLFHPTLSSPDLAFKFITELPEHNAHRIVRHDRWRNLITSMCLRLAHRLVDDGRLSDAQHVLEFTATYLPEQFGDARLGSTSIAPMGRNRKSEDQRQYLQALDALLAT